MSIYLDHNTISAAKVTDIPINRSVSGYGNRIPTAHMIKLSNNRWYRVYAICYSNVASYYITIGNGFGRRFLDCYCFEAMGV